MCAYIFYLISSVHCVQSALSYPCMAQQADQAIWVKAIYDAHAVFTSIGALFGQVIILWLGVNWRFKQKTLSSFRVAGECFKKSSIST